MGEAWSARGAAMIVVLGAWSALWWGGWQPLLADWPGVRVAIAVLLWLVPGACVERALDRRAPRPARDLTAGFLFAVALTGCVGLVASVLHWPFDAVRAGLWLAGVAGIAAAGLAARASRRGWHTATAWRRCAILLPAVLAAVIVARLAVVPRSSGDNFTYVALLTEFASGQPLGFGDAVLGRDQLSPSRFWLAFWPLALAVIGRTAGMGGLELTTLYIGPLLALLACVAIFRLARTMGCGYALAGLAVVVQVVCLLMLPARMQPGGVFVERLRMDKVVAAFVMAPAWLGLIAEFVRAPSSRRWTRVALGGVALLFTHPTMLAVAALIALLFAALEAIARMRLRPAVWVVAVVVALPLVPFSFRFVDQPFSDQLYFDLESAQRADGVHGRRATRVEALDGGWFRAPPHTLSGLPAAVLAAGAVVALLRVRRARAARYVLAASIVVACAYVPWTAWLLARAITPFHLWRIAWFAPFGLAAVLLTRAARGRFDRRGAAALLMLGEVALLGMALGVGGQRPWRPLPADWRETVVLASERPECAMRYRELASFGASLDDAIDGEAAVLGDRTINDYLPGAAAKAKMIVFRQPHDMWTVGIEREEVARRLRLHALVYAATATPAERLAAADALGARYLVECDSAAGLEVLRRAAPSRLTRVAQVGALAAYRLLPESADGAP